MEPRDITPAVDAELAGALLRVQHAAYAVEAALIGDDRIPGLHEDMGTVRTDRPGVECPSLSPDGTRVAYKSRVDGGWRPHVLDLATGRDTTLAETASVDDQAVWTDARSPTRGPYQDGTAPACTPYPPTGPALPCCCAPTRPPRRPSTAMAYRW